MTCITAAAAPVACAGIAGRAKRRRAVGSGGYRYPARSPLFTVRAPNSGAANAVRPDVRLGGNPWGRLSIAGHGHSRVTVRDPCDRSPFRVLDARTSLNGSNQCRTTCLKALPRERTGPRFRDRGPRSGYCFFPILALFTIRESMPSTTPDGSQISVGRRWDIPASCDCV